MSTVKIQSIEPDIVDLANGWLKSYGLDYKLEQASLNSEIDNALTKYSSKGGGNGGNKPDTKLLLQDKNMNSYPIIIEYKGYEDKLVKLNDADQVYNTEPDNTKNYNNIKNYAVNGAIHYANALLHYTFYTDIIAIGMTGFKNEKGIIEHKIGVYLVSKSNLGAGQKIDDFTDFSFLKKENFDDFIEKALQLALSQEELDVIKEQKERGIEQSLIKLNNDVYVKEKGLGKNDLIYLVSACIIANLGIPDKMSPLEAKDLVSKDVIGDTDGDILMRTISAFLHHKALPIDKKDLIIRTLTNTITNENINKVVNGETQLKRIFTKIIDYLGIYYKIGLTTDFTGKLFNEMYSWLDFASSGSKNDKNDVVLTPSYVATLLSKLTKVNKDSYVWDFATGSAGLLVAAMNEMLIDAKINIKSPADLIQKEISIKADQLLGLEHLPSIYMLAVLNMILMGDGSSNILNKDSLKDFDGNYGFGKTETKFPANVLVLNPPYSEPGNGMIFVKEALGKMQNGYGAVLIQNSSGSGKAIEYNKTILINNTLIASIKMPVDLFIGKSSVQTYIYVFRVGEAHDIKSVVKFIDFSNDGYTRTNRKKASVNLKDTDNAKERYAELVDLVHFGKKHLHHFTQNDYYEGHIDPDNGADWNQVATNNTVPALDEFKKTISDYLSWDISQLLKNSDINTSKK